MPSIRLATQIRRALASSPRTGDAAFEALGGVAVQLAKLVDESEDHRVKLAALGRLETTLVRLGLGGSGEPGGVGAGDGGAAGGGGQSPGDELGSLMGAGPVGGNAADA